MHLHICWRRCVHWYSYHSTRCERCPLCCAWRQGLAGQGTCSFCNHTELTEQELEAIADGLFKAFWLLFWAGLLFLMHRCWQSNRKTKRKAQGPNARSAVRAPPRTASNRSVHMALLSLRFLSWWIYVHGSGCVAAKRSLPYVKCFNPFELLPTRSFAREIQIIYILIEYSFQCADAEV